MAAVTQIRRRVNYSGSKRQVLATLNIGANGQTYDTKLRMIDFWAIATPDTNGIGGTVSGGVVTFATGGAENPCFFIAIGT